MNGAIFFSGQYGSTEQYAEWISEATGLPVFDVNHSDADPTTFDFLVLGSSVIIYKLSIRQWAKTNLAHIIDKPTILFTVSGEPPGSKLSGWIADSLPERLVLHAEHVALRGRLQLEKLSWWVRLVMRIGAWKNDDPLGKKHELEGFDFMDKSSIEPIIARVLQLQPSNATASTVIERKPLSLV